MSPRRTASLCVLALALGSPALAQQAEPPAPAGGEAPAGQTPAERAGSRVRASHRVDVIGPGEKVETVIERLRAARQPPSTGEARPADRSPGRGGEQRRDEQRAGSEQRRDSERKETEQRRDSERKETEQRRDSERRDSERRAEQDRLRPPDGQHGPPGAPGSADRSGPDRRR